MTKPVLEVQVRAPVARARSNRVQAVVDTGSFQTLIHQSVVPPGAAIAAHGRPRGVRTASRKGRLRITGITVLHICIEGKWIETSVLISPDLSRDMVIGAGAMQMWDISVKNRRGKTRVTVGRDLSDPELSIIG